MTEGISGVQEGMGRCLDEMELDWRVGYELGEGPGGGRGGGV